MDKAQSQAKHAKRRALERYDLELSDRDLREIVRLIQAGKAQKTLKQSHRVTVCWLQFQGKTIKVVYDKSRKSIASFLPMEDRV